MTVAEWIVRYLAKNGVRHIHEVSGGMITPLLDAADRIGEPTLVSHHHEQAAGFAAEGEARITRIPGVAMATSGPGATNLLTAIASCYFDSVPAIFITGQVASAMLKHSSGIRQLGFQETDIVAMAKPITKVAWQITNVADVPAFLDAAWSTALRGRRGPVLLDIPFDFLRAAIGDEQIAPVFVSPPPTIRSVGWSISDAITALRAAKRPLVLVGGGCRDHLAAVNAALKAMWIPAVHSLMAKDVLTEDHPLRVGFIGSYGNRWANWALANCDTLLVLGSRLDVRQIGNVKAFRGEKTIIQVDVDAGEIGQRIEVDHEYVGDVSDFACKIVDAADGGTNGFGISCEEWRREIAARREAWPAATENEPCSETSPNTIMGELGRAAWEFGIDSYVVDVGAHQMWAAQSLPVYRGQRFLTSGGHGSMGFALPAAIGAALAGQKVLVIVGDGGFAMSSGALRTIARLQLPIKIVVMDNQGHGMVRQFQREVFRREVSTGLGQASALAIAEAYGIDCVGWVGLFASNRPAIASFTIDPSFEALPKVRFGSSLTEMDGHNG